MQEYLEKFYNKLKKYQGSLVRVSTIKDMDKNAKEYLNKLAKQGLINRIVWGWYYIKPEKEASLFDFLRQDRNFKAIIGQSAASFWNNDFIHRETVKIVVSNKSLKVALEGLSRAKKWKLIVEYKDARKWTFYQKPTNVVDKVCTVSTIKKAGFEKIENLFVENPDKTIIYCIKHWAFADAISVLTMNKNKINWKNLIKNSYWSRISGTDIRVRQVIEYAAYELKQKGYSFDARKINIENIFVKKNVDESLEKVLEFE